ncbi:hypothetical protein [Paraburkholderia sacchari]|uniref:hypothetical protein n=1 Tax=Paraburkholderia sacchari TaxID=159450 RepID=UPI001BCB75A2|nr:hypothetical protein [Paraburkholderia sacchari]
MKAKQRVREPSLTESLLDARAAHASNSSAAYPISDPWLRGVSELLTRICQADSIEVARWMAGDALVLLRAYVVKQNGQSN